MGANAADTGVHAILARFGTSWSASRRSATVCSGVPVPTHPRPLFRLWATDPLPRFVIGFEAQDVFDFMVWAKGLDMPLAVPGVVEFKNNAQLLHILTFSRSDVLNIIYNTIISYLDSPDM